MLISLYDIFNFFIIFFDTDPDYFLFFIFGVFFELHLRFIMIIYLIILKFQLFYLNLEK